MANPRYLVIVNVDPNEWQVTIGEVKQVVGRSARSDVQVPAKYSTVSRRHAEVWRDGKGNWLRDLGSTSRTRVNGVLIQPFCACQVKVGDRVSFGELELGVVASLQRLQFEGVPADNGTDDNADPTKNTYLPSVPTAHLPDTDALFRELTSAERDVVLWMSRGVTQPEQIARKLFRSPNTVRTQLNSIYRKLNVHARDELLSKLRGRGAWEDSDSGPPAKV